MRILYFLPSVSARSDTGVMRKVSAQIESWVAQGHQVRCIAITDENFFSHPIIESLVLPNAWSRFAVFGAVIERVKKFQPDMIYCRYFFLKPIMFWLAATHPMVMELNTNDSMESGQMAHGIVSILRQIQSRLTRRLLLPRCRGFVSVTYEISKLPQNVALDRPFHVSPNSIELVDTLPLRVPEGGIRPIAVFVGSPGLSWHGLDRILELAQLCKLHLDFEIVGLEGESKDNVRYCGFQKGLELSYTLSRASLGLGSFALDRAGLQEACPLKSRSYLQHGLPLVLGYKDTMFHGRERPWWVLELQGLSDGVNSTHAAAVLAFAESCKGRKVSKQEALPFVDGFSIESGRLDFLMQLAGTQKYR